MGDIFIKEIIHLWVEKHLSRIWRSSKLLFIIALHIQASNPGCQVSSQNQ